METPPSADTCKLLTWIHSNRAITPKHYKARFKPEHTLANACDTLARLEKKGYLQRAKAFLNSDSFYSLNYKTLKYLESESYVLLSPSGREPKQSTYEKEHDKRVTNIRILFEKSSLPHLLWISDYEMRCSLNLDHKKALARRDREKMKTLKREKNTRRVPDAVFECRLKGKTWTFILEYEHFPYSKERINSLFLRLYKEYPTAIKTIIVKEPNRMGFLRDKIGKFVTTPEDRASWIFADYENLIKNGPLNTPWIDLDSFYFLLFKA